MHGVLNLFAAFVVTVCHAFRISLFANPTYRLLLTARTRALIHANTIKRKTKCMIAAGVVAKLKVSVSVRTSFAAHAVSI